MLVLTRTPGRTIYVGRTIQLKVITVDVGRARAKFEAWNGPERTYHECGIGESFLIDSTRFSLLGIGVEDAVRVGVDAPATEAVSRDDIPYSRHLRYQERREMEGA